MRTACMLLLASLPLAAHVGSPDIFHQGNAGPYRLLVTIRPPQVVPGVAEIEIRSASPEVRRIEVVPLRLDAPGGQFAPKADLAKRSKEDPQFYTGSLWLMATGSWEVRIDVDGARGSGRLAIPVPALPARALAMQRTMGAILLPLALLLCAGAIGIVGASVREGQLRPGADADAESRRRGRTAMASTAVVMAGVLYLGNLWWNSEAGWYRRLVYKPLGVSASVNGSRLHLKLEEPGWLNRSVDDLLPDHNHLMHLYVLRLPEMERVWHLHPERTGSGEFEQALPDMPAGRYALYGDIVHRNGLPETVTAELTLSGIAGRALEGDDSACAGPPRSAADYNRIVSPLGAGYRMVWERPAAAFRARQPALFRFRVEDADGKPAQGMELYMGMQGHAAFIRADRGVFAHVHPSGSVPMAALGLTQPSDPHAGHAMMMQGVPAEVEFPYGFPSGGEYRIIVQVKREGRVETGVFDARVEN